MSLKDQITEDMKAAMRAKDSERLGAIRLPTQTKETPCRSRNTSPRK